MKITLTAVLLFTLIFSSCKKEEPEMTDRGYSYFPYRVGSMHIYDVDSTVYDDFDTSVTTYKYQLREIIESTIVDGQGREALRVERYKRTDESDIWQIYNVWTAIRTATTAERVEDNKRLIKLIFPVAAGRKWNGNSFNAEQEQLFQYTQTDVAETIGSNNFEKTTTVLQIDDTNILEKNYAIEKYVYGVGMVYKEYEFLEYFFPTPQIRKGVILKMTLKEYAI